MVRRWLIRGLALTLLTLCVVAWVGSYFQRGAVHLHGGDHIRMLGLECGAIGYVDDDMEIGIPYAWQWFHGPNNFQQFRQVYQHTFYHFIGFAYDPKKLDLTTIVIIPLWFPTVLSALLLWLVWRKTRPAYNGRGFPVEVAAKEATTP
jgi:hypothetical protein